MSFEIFNEDCISGMSKLADGSVDSIICDLSVPAQISARIHKMTPPK